MPDIVGGTIKWNLDIDSSKLSRGLSKAKSSIKSFAKSAEKAAPGLLILGAASAAALGLIVKSAIDFESSFAGVRKTVDASEEEFAQLAQNFRNIAKETPLATDQLNRIGELAGQLGVTGVKNLTKFTRTIADISVTTNLMEEEAATAFARIANIMQEPIDNVDRMGATVVELGNNFATTESEIVNFANRIAGAGRIAGLSTHEILAIGAAMSSVGVQAEAGGTAVQKVLIGINTAVVQGNEDLTTLAKVAGISAKEFQKAWKEDPSKVFENFILDLGKAGDDAITILSDLGLEDQRLIRSFLSLAGAGDLITDTLKTSSKAWDANTALTEEAEKRYATVASQIKILANRLKDIAITIGDSLLPEILKLVESAKPMIAQFAEFAKNNSKLIVSILLAGVALGVIGGAILILSPLIVALTSTFGLVAIGIAALAVGWINDFGNVRTFTTFAIKAIIKVFDLLKVAAELSFGFIVDFWNNKLKPIFEDLKEIVEDSLGKAIKKFDEFKEKIAPVVETLRSNVGKIASSIKTIAEALSSPLTLIIALPADFEKNLFNIRDITEDVFKQLPGFVEESVTKIGEFMVDEMERIVSGWADWAAKMIPIFDQWITDTIVAIDTWVQDTLDAFFDWAAKMIPIFDQWITDTVVAIDKWITDTIVAIDTWVQDTLDAFFDWGAKTLMSVDTSLDNMFDSLNTFFTDLPDQFTVWLDQVWEDTKGWWSSLGENSLEETLKGFEKEKDNWILKIGGFIIAALVLILAFVVLELIDLGIKMIGFILEGIKSTDQFFKDKIGDFLKGALDLGTKLKDALFDFGKDMLSKIVEGIKSAPGAIIEAITSILPGGSLGTSIGKALHIPGFQEGGVVPGPIGTPQLAVVHGGEEIIPTGGTSKGGIVINQTNNITKETDMEAALRELGWQLSI